MNRYSTPDFLAKVLNAYDIDYTQQKVLCPFHGDINPSMLVELDKSRVYCYGCQKSYTAFDFVKSMHPEKTDFELYSLMSKIDKCEEKIYLPQVSKNKDIDYDQLLIESKDYYYNLPSVDWSEDWSDEADYLFNRGYDSKLLNSCGVKKNINIKYPIILPIIDNGEFKGWICRTTDKDVEKQRKYLYNTGFRRSDCLCGRYQSNRPLIITEGYFDMLKIRQAGYKNVVSIFGWKISKEQIDKLKKTGIKQIIVALDNDEKGNEGYDYLKSLNLFEIKRWRYNQKYKDIGEYSVDELKKVLDKTGLLC